MIDRTQVQQGMLVYSGEHQELGRIERIDADSITVNGQQYELSSIERVEGGRAYLTRQVGATVDRSRTSGASVGQTTGEREIRVPEVEERLEVEKRPVEAGEVQIHRTVEEERQTVPVELRREEVHVEQRDVPERPLRPGEDAFREETIRVPLRGEEAVARKEAVVTGEVVVDKEQTTERQEVSDTVRRERVEVEGDEEQTSDASARRRAAGATTGSMAATTTETGGTTGQLRDRELTASDTTRGMGSLGVASRTTLIEDMEVVGADDQPVGRVKEVRDGDFLVDRPSARDVYVPLDAVTDVASNRVRLNVQAHEVDDMGWPKPSLF